MIDPEQLEILKLKVAEATQVKDAATSERVQTVDAEALARGVLYNAKDALAKYVCELTGWRFRPENRFH